MNLPTGSEAPRPLGVGQSNPAPGRNEALAALCQQAADLGFGVAEVLEHLARTQPNGGRLARNGRPMPTVSEYRATIEQFLTDSTRVTYKSHLNRLEAAYGDWLIDTIFADDLDVLAQRARTEAAAAKKPATRGGLAAEENAVAAFRWFFKRAVTSRYLESNPAAGLRKPPRGTPVRRALEGEELAEVFLVASTTGNDPRLDAILVRFDVETGARREGAINLTLARLDPTNQLVQLVEKYGKSRWVPVSRELMDALIAFAAERGSVGDDDAVFRFKPTRTNTVGEPLSRRRYNTLFDRVQAELPWASRLGVSTHWLRHTAGTAMERIGGVAIAAEFLGHAHRGNVTYNYIRAVAREVCDVFSIRMNEQHPLATPGLITTPDGD